MDRIDFDFSEYERDFNRTLRSVMCESAESDMRDISDRMDESEVTYQKIRRILNCPEMIKAHAFLYALDQENVDESNREKIDRLYELGKARGVIQDDAQEDGDTSVDECGDEDDTQIFGGPDDALTSQEMTPVTPDPAKVSSAFTVLYSAMKDGQVKTGEYFSSATDSEAAKQDCIASLSPLGYSCIRVLGIEQANDAVDMGHGLDEDDSKEYEDQETGAGDTGDSEKADGKSQDGKDADGGDGKAADEKTDSAEDKDSEPDGKKDAEEDSGEKPEEDAEKTDVDNADQKPQDDGGKRKLSATDKQVLRDEYVGMFKAELQRTKLEKSVEDMTVKEKADFWGTIAKKWTKEDPEEFLSDREIEKLNNTVIRNG